MQPPIRYKFRFLLTEKITFVYFIITLLIVLLFNIPFAEKLPIIATRIYVTLIILFLTYLSTFSNSTIIVFVRQVFLGYLLSIWYPETFDFNRYFPNKDYLIAGFEQKVFGMQPALAFHKLLPQNWFSEIMNFGYLAYYPIMILSGMYFYITDRKQFKYFYFIVLFSFYIYYIIYILFPTAGPQYYYCTIGAENIQNGFFPRINEYFNFQSHLNCVQDNQGFFLNLVEKTQLAGERPTAAFPSSHVGITTLILFVFLEKRKYFIFALLLPVYAALVAATVYIQAHYLIDVMAGLLSSTLFYFSGKYIYKKFLLNLEDNSDESDLKLINCIKANNKI
ncbi:MAG: phosphatase PAP2 family protein [Paludibacter sp.]|nr:phosphatase PAP2 family protein [Paludibacter sp.]